MDILREEIARKRKCVSAVTNGKRYFKRSDLEKREREEYLQRWGDKLEARKVSPQKPVSEERQAQSEKPQVSTLSQDEIKRRLRQRNEPIRLFGEEDSDVFDRLRALELSEPEWRGQRNDFKEAMDQVDREYLDELLNDGGSSTVEAGRKIQVQCPEPPMSYEELATIMANRSTCNIPESTLISACFKIILKQWADHLNERPDEQCRAVAGKIETALFQQTLSYLNPLFRKLKAGTLPADILDSLIDVVHSLFQRNYRRANEYFLELAIGNAPWPIGATNVGIHPRPGREKIASKHVAHVLNDETQRKYLQAVKRIITKAQLYYPGEPALSVEYQNPACGEDDA